MRVTFDPSSHESIFFSKFKDWSYEQEVRVAKPLNECEVLKLNSKSNLYLHRLPMNHVSKVILGWNMSSEVKDSVRKKVHSINTDLKVVEAHFERGKLELQEF